MGDELFCPCLKKLPKERCSAALVYDALSLSDLRTLLKISAKQRTSILPQISVPLLTVGRLIVEPICSDILSGVR